MAKGSKARGVALGFIFFPLVYVTLLRCDVSPPLLPRLSSSWSLGSKETGMEVTEFSGFLLRRLVRGSARRELSRNGVTCISDTESDTCITSDSVRLTTGKSPTVLYLTGGQQLSRQNRNTLLQLVITDYEEYWVKKYRRILARLSSFDIIVASSTSSSAADEKVHCFPAAVVGLRYHGNLLCNSTSEPGGVSTADFRNFLHAAFSLRNGPMGPTNSPTMVLLSRRKSRKILNEENVAELAREVGFRVIVATQEVVRNLQNFTELVNGCNVLMGVHGAGLTNLMFLRPQAVVLQVVPWGLDWASTAYYARPAKRLGLQYVEYHIEVEESSLCNEYPKDHPVLTDPWGINLKGYNVSKPVYTDGQNVRINLARFKDTLLKARELVRNPSKVSVE
ncbi:uncharacterized protein A4U43_C01F29550 [Asparagus officinalis]|uniref:Glycosyltransferase 61 catalytic domain-containing protein n=1 Tax=Asparagus officinalis TaxID=4686 RepID=A0A5P1FVH6_ASPOF|nr:uncharacterized protein A4U43_C01F29550 [Asparagus officinalis]